MRYTRCLMEKWHSIQLILHRRSMPTLYLLWQPRNISFADYILGASEQFIIANSSKIPVCCVNPKSSFANTAQFMGGWGSIKMWQGRSMLLPCHLMLCLCHNHILFFLASFVFASATNPPITPRFIESSAELGTITIEPFSLRPSYSIFIPLKMQGNRIISVLLACFCKFFCNLGFRSSKDYLAFLSRSACACLLMASARACGMIISLIPTVWHVIPQGFVLASRVFWRSSAIFPFPEGRSASFMLSYYILRSVWAIKEIAFTYSWTSRAAFSTSQTVQYTTASTFTGNRVFCECLLSPEFGNPDPLIDVRTWSDRLWELWKKSPGLSGRWISPS